MSLARLCNAYMVWARERMEEAQWDQFHRWVETPPMPEARNHWWVRAQARTSWQTTPPDDDEG